MFSNFKKLHQIRLVFEPFLDCFEESLCPSLYSINQELGHDFIHL